MLSGFGLFYTSTVHVFIPVKITTEICILGSRKNLCRHFENTLHHSEKQRRHPDRRQELKRDHGQRDRGRKEQKHRPRPQRTHLHRQNKNLRFHGKTEFFSESYIELPIKISVQGFVPHGQAIMLSSERNLDVF